MNKKCLVFMLAIVLLIGAAMPVMAVGEPFGVLHRSQAKLSMSDQGFKKDECVRSENETHYILTLHVQPISKKMFGTTYWADITEIKVNIEGNLVSATPHGQKKAVNSTKMVPVYFTVNIPKNAAFSQNVGIEGVTYTKHFKIWFETNLEDSGAGGVIGNLMMNRNARYAF